MLKETLRVKGGGLVLTAAFSSWVVIALGSLVLARRDVIGFGAPLALLLPLMALLRRPWARRYRTAFAVVVVATYGGFALLEVAVRLRCFGADGLVHPLRYSLQSMSGEPVADPKTLYRLRPRYQGFASGAPIRTNSLGFRGPEFAEAKAPGVLRVLCFGSSLTMGEGVAESDTWPSVVSGELSRRTGRRVETMNMGIAAYSPLQILNLADEMVPRFAPDVVVLDLDPSHPLEDKLVALPEHEPVTSAVRRYSFAAQSIEFVPSRLGALIERVNARLHGRPASAAAGSFAAFDDRLAQLAEIGRQRHFSVVVIVIRPMADFLGLRQMDPATQRRTAALSARTGIRFVDTFPLFAPTELPDDFIIFPGNAHPSAEAHHRFARAVAETIAAHSVNEPAEPAPSLR